ncbi:hypothetical protein K4L05_08900 [Phaeobacter inhibens]|uniref:hypothetical protein n=1 Tax=Phaeobacter inhibens TaxID=221822 RepID=UPI0021A6E539|nr:hypothetical protein [Phaeobacter inhibens]UWR82882.1 hypothetical protein K4L05_08900 [Phaeobacter inhibens]
MERNGAQSLWVEVLLIAISDALFGERGVRGSTAVKINAIMDARRYLTVPNRDCDLVCELAGIDPDAFRTRMRTLIDAAPSPPELIGKHSRVRTNRAGVVFDFMPSKGTGGGRSAQDSPNISFSEKEAC